MNEEKIIIDRDTIVAFCSLHNCHCHPFYDAETGRVKFVVSGPVSEALLFFGLGWPIFSNYSDPFVLA